MSRVFVEEEQIASPIHVPRAQKFGVDFFLVIPPC